MNKDSRVSALFDGELDDHEVATAIRAALADDASADWPSYALIGDCLRGEVSAPFDCTSKVMARLQDEPVVLAPKNLARREAPNPMFALAASLAGVAMVGWLALSNDLRTPDSGVAYKSVASAPTMARVEPVRLRSVPMPRAERSELGEYFVAHHAQAGAIPLGEGAQHIRTVSMIGEGARR